jgi:ABC-type branched-subunit amino acid transport system substrate-binding protein
MANNSYWRVLTRSSLGAVLGLATMLTPLGGAGAAEPGDYKIGFVTENTGPIAFAGLSYWRGAQLAASEISASGYMGQNTKLSLVDKESASDPARAIQDMRQFVADRTVIATTCCILSPVAGSLKPIAISSTIPLVIFGATAAGLPQAPYVQSMTILPGPKDVATAKMVADAVKPKTAAYFVAADNDAFKARMAASQHELEGMGIKTVAVVSVLSADTDFTAPATQAMGAKPDMVLVYATQTPAVGIVAALRARDYAGTIVGNDVMSPEPVFKKLGPASKGVMFPISFSADLAKSDDGKAFVAAYRKEFNAEPDIYSAQGYAVAYFVAQGLKSISGKPTRESLAQALSQITTLDHNVYGGERIVNGQAETPDTLVVSWSPEGKLVPWKPAQ